MKRIAVLLPLLLLLSSNSVLAETFEVNGIWYETIDNRGNVAVAPPPEGSVYKGAIDIKGSVSDNTQRKYTVKKIGANAFAGATGVTSVKLDDNLEEIEENAFSGCTGITSIQIPERTTVLGVSAFDGCTKLGTVTLSRNLKTIKERAFAECHELSRIEAKDKITEIGAQAFYNCRKLSVISLPATLKTIGTSAFEGCSVLNNVKLGEKIASVGEAAFKDCKALTEITIPNNITEIKTATFSGCKALKTIGFPRRIEVISASAFRGTGVTEITIPESVTELGDAAFMGAKYLTRLTLEDNSSKLRFGVDVFKDCPLEYVALGRTLNYINGATGAFAYHKELKTTTISSTVTTLPTGIYQECSSLVNVTVESGLKEVGESAFEKCETLVTLHLPETVQIIRDNAFSECYILADFELPKAVDIIRLRTFYRCRHLPELDISNITEIENQGFSGCDALQTISFPAKLKRLGNDAFSNCLGLTSVTVPGTIEEIGDGVFSSCRKLTSVTFETGGKTLRAGHGLFIDAPVSKFELNRDILFTGEKDRDQFDNMATLTSPTIGKGVTRIAETMFSGCASITSVELPASVDFVGQRAFAGCTDIRSVTSLNGDVPEAFADSFDDDTYSKASLTVPEDSREDYENADGWRNFTSLKTVPGLPKYTVTVSATGPGRVLLNGKNEASIKITQGKSLAITTMPDTEYVVRSASYTMEGKKVEFNDGATIPSVTGNVDVTVVFGEKPPTPPTSISITQDNIMLQPGENVRLTVEYTPAGTYSDITWSIVSGSKFITLDADGTVTAVRRGDAVVRALTANGKAAEAGITVYEDIEIPEQPEAIRISPESAEMSPGDELQLFLEFDPADSYSYTEWAVIEGEGIVTVDDGGKVTALKNGHAVVEVTTANDLSAKAVITVNSSSIRIEAIPHLDAGQKWQTRLLDDNKPIEEPVRWSTQSDFVTITESGLLTVTKRSYDFFTARITAEYSGATYSYDFFNLPMNVYSFTAANGLNYTFEDGLDAMWASGYGNFDPGEELIIEDNVTDEYGMTYPVDGIWMISLPENVKYAELPAGFRHIENFSGTGLTEVICHATTVPTVKNMNLGNAVVYVPASAVEAYRADSAWGVYTIRAIGDSGETPENPDEPETYTYSVYFVPQADRPAASTPYCYVWSGDGDKLYAGAWPGSITRPVLVNNQPGWEYTFTTEDKADDMKLIFSDGVDQTSDMYLTDKGVYDRNGLIGTGSEIADRPVETVTETVYSALGEDDIEHDMNFINVDLDSHVSNVWSWGTYSGKHHLSGTAYIKNVSYRAISIAHSPEIDLTQVNAPVEMSFEHAARYQNGNVNYEFHAVVSTDGENWTILNIPVMPVAGTWDFRASGSIDLSKYAGQKIYVGLRYSSTADAADTWRVRNLKVIGQKVPSGISDVTVPGDDSEARLFDLQGRPVVNPAPGMYIRISNGKTEKIVIR